MTKGKKLRDYRRARGISQQELAEAAGLSHKSAISRREAGEIALTAAEFFDLCAAIERIVERRAAELSPADVL